MMRLVTAAKFKGFRFVRSEKLAGRKYALKYANSDEIYVSPAVYDLLSTDFDAVAKKLRVRMLDRQRRELV